MATLDELAARIAALEQRQIDVEDIPLTELQRKLEQKWNPDAAVLLQPHSITSDLLDNRMSTPAYRSVRGSVKADGSILRGTGFAVTKNGTGDYTVTFDDPFAVVPVVVAQNVSWMSSVQESSRTVSSFRCITFVTTTGTSTDLGWDFIAATPS